LYCVDSNPKDFVVFAAGGATASRSRSIVNVCGVVVPSKGTFEPSGRRATPVTVTVKVAVFTSERAVRAAVPRVNVRASPPFEALCRALMRP